MDHRAAKSHNTHITDDNPSTWNLSVIHALDLHTHHFQYDPAQCNTFSKCFRKGKELELSGSDVYNTVMLSLGKALDHLATIETPPGPALYSDARLSLAMAVLDAPMLLAHANPAETQLTLVPWVRVIRHAYSQHSEHFKPERLYFVDVVHSGFLEEYLKNHLLPFSEEFAQKALSHPTELATGEAFVAGLGKDGWNQIESRLRPKQLDERVKRTRAVGRQLFQLFSRRRSNVLRGMR